LAILEFVRIRTSKPYQLLISTSKPYQLLITSLYQLLIKCLCNDYHRLRGNRHRRWWLRDQYVLPPVSEERTMPSRNNRLLASLSTNDRGMLEPHLEVVTLALRKRLEQPNRRIDAVYFPHSGFASVVAIQSSKKQVEVGLIGREGMSGLPIVLGNHRSPHSTYIQAAGDGQCIRAGDLRKAMSESPSLRDSLLKYVQAFSVQATHTAVCNAQSRLDQRLARWLLMAHDRMRGDLLPLTHEFLSIMLGVRRPGVTDALSALQRQGLITCARGGITVKDRKGLERHAGESYGIPEAEYRRLIG
jgi:CRP-like cAMP-binding protein